jgi:single-strand DNA-binding protein
MMIVHIAGHLGQDPESRFTPTGQKVTTLRVATNVRKGGKDETVWWRVTIWGDRFDKMMPYLKKGSAIFVMGEMSSPRIYTDKNGSPQVSVEMTAEMISFNPFGKSGSGTKPQSGEGSEEAPQSAFTGKESYAAVAPGAGQANFAEADDIPF